MLSLQFTVEKIQCITGICSLAKKKFVSLHKQIFSLEDNEIGNDALAKGGKDAMSC